MGNALSVVTFLAILLFVLNFVFVPVHQIQNNNNAHLPHINLFLHYFYYLRSRRKIKGNIQQERRMTMIISRGEVVLASARTHQYSHLESGPWGGSLWQTFKTRNTFKTLHRCYIAENALLLKMHHKDSKSKFYLKFS